MSDELRDYYLRALPARIDALENARAALASDDEAEATIRRIAHSLKGSGASYGFPRITEVAGALESAARQDLEARLDALIGVLRALTGDAPERGQHLVLIVDDDPDVTHLLRSQLAALGRVVVADSRAAAERFLAAETPSLVVLDLVLPDGDGRSLLMAMRERPATAAVPIVVLTATTSARARAECVALGADQVVGKPFEPALLAATVRQQLQRAAGTRDGARKDEATGLATRAAFIEEWTRARSSGASRMRVALLALDAVDHADEVDASHVKPFARIVSEALPHARCVARWGATELIALYAGADTPAAGDELRDLLDRWRAGGEGTASAGAADVTDGADLETVVAEARRALYVARANGGDRVVSPDRPADAPARRILLAEDDALTASLILHRLRREGLDVDHHATGDGALAAARENQYALAVLDVKMPGMDGFEVLRALRSIARYRAAPILMLTSMGSEEDVVRGLQLGATDYVLKPFSPVELVARVHRHLR